MEKKDIHIELTEQIRALFNNEFDLVANMSNMVVSDL